MDLAHETALNDLIRDVIDTGVGRVEKRLLLRWFGAKNMTKKIWSGVRQRFTSELTERGEQSDGWDLFIIDGETISLVCFNPENTETWWRPISFLELGI